MEGWLIYSAVGFVLWLAAIAAFCRSEKGFFVFTPGTDDGIYIVFVTILSVFWIVVVPWLAFGAAAVYLGLFLLRLCRKHKK